MQVAVIAKLKFLFTFYIILQMFVLCNSSFYAVSCFLCCVGVDYLESEAKWFNTPTLSV